MRALIIGTIITNLILLPSVSMGQDYPAGYLGEGYRKYLKDKVQNGYYVETFTDLQNRQEERINKRNQVEEIISHSYTANRNSTEEIQKLDTQKEKNVQVVNQAIELDEKRVEKNASNQTEFKYVKHTDGKVVYFMSGLATRVENERVVDEFGNLSNRDTTNMQYNDTRLLTSYDATLKDNLGNISNTKAYGLRYTPDSVFYGDYETKANKHELEKYIRETDSAGNEKLTHWQASIYNGVDGKLLRAFTQEIEDSVYGNSSLTRTNITYENNNYKRMGSYDEEGTGTDGLKYVLSRNNITYNAKDMVNSYHEETITTHIDGEKIESIADAQFEYLYVPHQFGDDVEEPDPDKLLKSTTTNTTRSSDGSEKTETAITNYDYDKNQLLTNSLGSSTFVGQEADWWEYKDKEERILARIKDQAGNEIFVYVNPDTGEKTVVSEDEVVQTLKPGDKYSGSSEIKYEILYGKPMTSQTESVIDYYNPDTFEVYKKEDSIVSYTNGLVNNLQKVLETQEHTEMVSPFSDPADTHREISDVRTTYFYDNNGNIIDTQGKGEKTGFEYSDERGWWGEYTATIWVDYEVILGKALRKRYFEDRAYEKGGNQ